MFRLIAGGFVLTMLTLGTGPVSADDKDKVTWTRSADSIELKFEMGKDTAKFHVTAGENMLIVSSKIKIEKDVVTAEVTDVEVKGNVDNPPKKGDKVSFKWVVKGDKATLSDLKGDNVDNAKAVVEGEYKKQK